MIILCKIIISEWYNMWDIVLILNKIEILKYVITLLDLENVVKYGLESKRNN